MIEAESAHLANGDQPSPRPRESTVNVPPIREASAFPPAFAAPVLSPIHGNRCVPVRLTDRGEENRGAAPTRNRRSTRIRRGDRSKNADERQPALVATRSFRKKQIGAPYGRKGPSLESCRQATNSRASTSSIPDSAPPPHAPPQPQSRNLPPRDAQIR